MTCYYFGSTKNSPVIHISRTLHLHIMTYLSCYTKKERKKIIFCRRWCKIWICHIYYP